MDKLLKAILRKRGITQKALAEEIGISEGQLSKILNGTRRLSVNRVLHLSKITGIPIERFYR